MRRKISINNYIELNLNEFETSVDKMVQYISIDQDIEPHIIYEEWDSELLLSEYKKSLWLDTPFNKSDNKELIELDGVELYLFNFDEITLGHFIDLEHLISENYIENIPKIVVSIYLISEKEKFKERTYEDYSGVNIDERYPLVGNNIFINDVYYSIEKYMNFRQSFFKHFDNIFGGGEEEIDLDLLTEEERKIYLEELEKDKIKRKSMWSNIIDICSGGDVTKYNEVLGTNIFLIFSKLTKYKNENK